jgi:hypothetical protein
MNENIDNPWENMEKQTVYFKAFDFRKLAQSFESLHSRVRDFMGMVGSDTAGIEIMSIVADLAEMKEYFAQHLLDNVAGTKVPVVSANQDEIIRIHDNLDEAARSLDTVGYHLPIDKKHLSEDLKAMQTIFKYASNSLYGYSQFKDRWDPPEYDVNSKPEFENERGKVGFDFYDYSQIHFDFEYFLKSLGTFHNFCGLYAVEADVAELESIESALLGEKIKADFLLPADYKTRLHNEDFLVEFAIDEVRNLLKTVNSSIKALQRLPDNTEEKYKGVAKQTVREAIVYLNDAKKIIQERLYPGGKN